MKNASAIFEGMVFEALQSRLDARALATPLIFTDNLSNRVLAIHARMQDGTQTIAVNARFKVDPEILAPTLVEEYVHAHQILEGLDVATQKQQFPDYAARLYEQEAKRIATEVLGYTPENDTAYLLRDEPSGVLYDRASE